MTPPTLAGPAGDPGGAAAAVPQLERPEGTEGGPRRVDSWRSIYSGPDSFLWREENDLPKSRRAAAAAAAAVESGKRELRW